MNMCEYYDGTKLLSLQDLTGGKPEIYLCTTNRTAGKTTFFGRLLVNRFLRKHEKFVLLYRFTYELSNIPNKFFNDLSGLFFNGYTMTDSPVGKGTYRELFLHYPNAKDDDLGESCGYAIALNNADQIKRYSPAFKDVESILLDEFQSETNHYCENEIEKFISIHTSIARGGGKQVRYVPVYMLSNAISLINPYYVELGISERLQDNTKFLKGNGFVLEHGYVASAANAQKESAFNRAFMNNHYIAYAAENIYLNDNRAFIEKPTGDNKYLATIQYNGRDFALREYAKAGYVYCGENPDRTFPFKIAVTTDDHQINYVMLKKNDFFISTIRYYFEHGCVRFKNMLCKQALMRLISY